VKLRKRLRTSSAAAKEKLVPSLRELQHAIRLSLIEGEDSAAAAFIIGDGLVPGKRLALYRNTFVSNMTNALRLSYPAVHRLVGAEFFEGAARIFVHERPPASAYLDEYGGGFPEFLVGFPPAASLSYLPEVARLEWAVNRALHAPDAEPLDVARLAAVEPKDHDRVRFVAHPSVSLVTADCPVDAIWRAVLEQDNAALTAIDLAAGRVWLLVERTASRVEVKRLDERAWRVANELCAGQPLGVALKSAEDLDLPPLLAEHIAAGRFVAFSLADVRVDVPQQAEERFS
jgi:hypothetical protein